MATRTITQKYSDPLDRIWLETAARLGLRVERTGDAYATTPGDGVLFLAASEHLDPDDSLAQMIFHEICHWLVQGEGARAERDWGLDNEGPRDVPREEACLRLQAALAGTYGLRRFFAPTTDFRSFYDALPEDPLSPRWDPTTQLAIFGHQRAEKPPFAPHVAEALRATRTVAEAAARFAPEANGDAGAPSDLWCFIDPLPPVHPSGLAGSTVRSSARTCGTCAWHHRETRCRQQPGARVRAGFAGCARWEAALDCQTCGACCRAAYDCVQVSTRDPVRRKHPELIVLRGPYLEVQRNGDRCAALGGGTFSSTGAPGGSITPYACSIYEGRPKSCRDFQNGGEHCLTARRRVGLSL